MTFVDQIGPHLSLAQICSNPIPYRKPLQFLAASAPTTMPPSNNATNPPLQDPYADNNCVSEEPEPHATKGQRNGSRGVGYTKVEDLLICKAFIRRSEDPITGNSQKGK